MIATSALKAMLSSSGSSGTNEAAPLSGPTSQPVNPPLAGGTRAERRCAASSTSAAPATTMTASAARGARSLSARRARRRASASARVLRRASVGSRTAAPELAGVTVFMSATR